MTLKEPFREVQGVWNPSFTVNPEQACLWACLRVLPYMIQGDKNLDLSNHLFKLSNSIVYLVYQTVSRLGLVS